MFLQYFHFPGLLKYHAHPFPAPCLRRPFPSPLHSIPTPPLAPGTPQYQISQQSNRFYIILLSHRIRVVSRNEFHFPLLTLPGCEVHGIQYAQLQRLIGVNEYRCANATTIAGHGTVLIGTQHSISIQPMPGFPRRLVGPSTRAFHSQGYRPRPPLENTLPFIQGNSTHASRPQIYDLSSSRGCGLKNS